jgi:deoxyadenosine/deoxycytidine kinase
MTESIVISVEGNIGVGKSTIVDKLKSLHLEEIEFISEPVDEWLKLKDEKGNNFLDIFYKDKKRWGYTFQNLAYITRMTNVVEKLVSDKNKCIITDRSIGTDKYVFGKMLHDDKYIDDLEWNIYNYWNNFFDKYIKHSNQQNVIYLRCTPEVAMERIKKRGRKEELTIEFEYIKKLSEYHDKWLLNSPNCNVLVLDCNNDFENNKEIFNDFVEKIKIFIKSL